MTTINFACLSCGCQFVKVASALRNKINPCCPECYSESVVETVPAGLSGFSGGG